MMAKRHQFILGLGTLVLLASLALVLIGTRPPPARTFQGTVQDLLPDPELLARAGWTVEPVKSQDLTSSVTLDVFSYPYRRIPVTNRVLLHLLTCYVSECIFQP